jgi:hypothetical protein
VRTRLFRRASGTCGSELHIAEDHNAEVVAIRQVRFRFAGNGLRAIVDLLRADQRVEAASLSISSVASSLYFWISDKDNRCSE